MFNYNMIKKIMFNFEPETAHHIDNTLLSQKIFNTTFHNPIGLAAGFDKNAEMIESMQAMGFGYTEIGTMTPKPQPGNAKPRLFRYPEHEAIQNAMGFNNEGSYTVIKNLS